MQAILADIEPQRSRQLTLSSMGPTAYFVPGTFDEIHRELLHETHGPDPASHVAVEALVCLLAARVSGHGKLPNAAMPEWLFQSMELIRSQYSCSLSLSEIAAASGVHRVRHYLGRSVGTYITDLRVAHARRELQATHRPIAEIAQEAGFYDESHMGRVFRRRPLGGIIHLHAPPRAQAAGALVAIISGLLGGLTAAFVAGRYPVRHAAAVIIFLCIDTGVVLSRPSPDPLWFDLAGAATLMLATVCGGALYSHLNSRLRSPGARNPAAAR